MKLISSYLKSQSFLLLVILSFTCLFQAAGAAPITPPPPIGVQKTANYRNMQVKLYYLEEKGYVSHPRIKILRNRKVVTDQELSVGDLKVFARIAPPLLLDLDGDWEAEAVFILSSEKGNCCNHTIIYSFDSKTQSYQSTHDYWGNGVRGPRFEDIDKDGIPELVAQDARFTSEDGNELNTIRPIRVWQYRKGVLIDVTRTFPAAVYQDALKHWNYFDALRKTNKLTPALARDILRSYLADKYLLGQENEAWWLLKEVYKEEDAENYFSQLEKFLIETDYAR